MIKSKLRLSVAVFTALLFVGCGNDDVSSDGNINSGDNEKVIKLIPQTEGTQSYLFYGNTKHSALGSLRNARVVDPNSPDTLVLSNDDTTNVRYPVLSTSLEYNTSTNSYKNLHVNTLGYVSGNNPYQISMVKGTTTPVAIAHSTDTNISSPSYTKIDYLGSKQYMSAKNAAGDSILITPDMSATDTALAFENKKLLALSYASFGAATDGYIVYDSNASGNSTKQIQKCTLDLTCTNIKEVTSKYKFIGDIGGTTQSAFDVDGHFYKLDKATGTLNELVVGIATPMDGTVATKAIRAAASSYYFSGDSIYFIDASHNISRYNITTGDHKYISSNGKTDRIRAFTNDMVIYGPTDSEMYAVKKDGTSPTAITIAMATKTGGLKYPYSMAVGNQYLFNKFDVNTQTGKTTFRACKLEDSNIECKDDSFWASITAAKDGTLNFDSTYKYTPYAYIRVDNTDNYGGGTLKAIDPKNAMQDGITLGTIATYNFQTFMDNSRYTDMMIDSEGGVVIYGKNDLDFRGDAFYVNLHKENSLKNLTNESAPDIADINGGRAHCHGRFCTVCHQFAGGKIYTDKAGSGSAKGYNVRFEFQDGETLNALVRKGLGENFNTPLENLVGKNFTAVVYNESNGSTATQSNEYSHRGIEYFNCNFCHGRKGALRHSAPNVITIEK